MKTLILILALIANLQADKILLSGVSFHGEQYNLDGKEVNFINYGIGYQKTYNHKGFDATATSLILKDSFNNLMVSVTYGIRKGADYKGINFSIGAEFGIAYKKILHKEGLATNPSFKYRYSAIPIAFIPTLSFKKDGYSIDVLYLPEINYDIVHIMSVSLIMIGIEI